MKYNCKPLNFVQPLLLQSTPLLHHLQDHLQRRTAEDQKRTSTKRGSVASVNTCMEAQMTQNSTKNGVRATAALDICTIIALIWDNARNVENKTTSNVAHKTIIV